MDAFEIIVGQCLEEKGYWVRHSVKVELTKEEKREIGLPTMPRAEIDLVALSVKSDQLMIVEVNLCLIVTMGSILRHSLTRRTGTGIGTSCSRTPSSGRSLRDG
jgi:hypothetical protein